MNKNFLLYICIALVTIPCSAQKKVLGKPEKFNFPTDCFESYELCQRQRNNTANKSRTNAWIVISDRDNNAVYAKPDYNSEKIDHLNFKEYFYVVDEEDDWVKIVNARVDRLKVTELLRVKGWVPKKNMLLWNSGLVSSNTSIHKKALLLIRIEDTESYVLKTIDYYRHPEFSENYKCEKGEPLYEYFFILKKENGKFLLSRDAQLSPYNFEDKILGWFDKRKIQEWNTRICLEPNFVNEAFQERQSQNKSQLRAFMDHPNADAYSKGLYNTEDVYWEQDPAGKAVSSKLVTKDNRFKGSIIRFPMLGKEENIYRSGIIGSYNIGLRQEFSKEVQQLKENINISIVVEATSETNEYKLSIAKAIREIGTSLEQAEKVKMSVLLYSDAPERERVTTSISPSTDLVQVADELENTSFINQYDQDNYTVLYEGIEEAVRNAEFAENETNILILLGGNGDFKADRDRRKDSEYNDPKKLRALYESIAIYKTHFYTLQLKRDDSKRESNAFNAQARYLMLESAKYAYNLILNSLNSKRERELMEKNTPTFKDVYNKSELINHGRLGIIRVAKDGKKMSSSQLVFELKKLIKQTFEFNANVEKLGEEMLSELDSDKTPATPGDNLDKPGAGNVGEAAKRMINKIIDKDLKEGDYNVFSEVYMPHKIGRAEYPTVSYVLFMPEMDLFEYSNVIERALTIGSDYTKKREQLYEIYKALIGHYSGEKDLSNREIEDITNIKLIKIMQGVYKEGLTFEANGSCNTEEFRIGDIRNERKMTSSEVEQRLQHFYDIKEGLRNVLRLGEEYPYCYTSDKENRYYWIPICEAF